MKIFGEDPNEENTSGPDASKSFVNKPKYKQAIVLFAGVFANFLLAWLLFSVGFMSSLARSVNIELIVICKSASLTVEDLLSLSVSNLMGSQSCGVVLE